MRITPEECSTNGSCVHSTHLAYLASHDHSRDEVNLSLAKQAAKTIVVSCNDVHRGWG